MSPSRPLHCGRRQEVAHCDGTARQCHRLDPLAAPRDREARVASLLGLRLAADLDAVVAQVDDPVLGDAGRRVDGPLGKPVLLEGAVRYLGNMQRRSRMLSVVVLDGFWIYG